MTNRLLELAAERDGNLWERMQSRPQVVFTTNVTASLVSEEALDDATKSFTRSNGTVFSRIYERLTKASRRRDKSNELWIDMVEKSYRQGVYDALSVLRKEIT